MIGIGAWCVAAVFLGIVCVLLWFFLKLFFRLALFLIALSFLVLFLYQYSLLPEPVLQYAEEIFFDIKDKLHERGWLEGHDISSCSKIGFFCQKNFVF